MWVLRWGDPSYDRFWLKAGSTKQSLRHFAKEFCVPLDPDEPYTAYRNRNPSSNRKELARYLSAESENETESLDNVLRAGLDRVVFTWESLKDRSDYPIARPKEPTPEPFLPEPTQEAFLPEMSLGIRLFPFLKRRVLNQANQEYSAAHSNWASSNAAVKERYLNSSGKYRRQLGKWEADRKLWAEQQARRNSEIDAKIAAHKRTEPEAVVEYCGALLKASPYPYIVASNPEIALGQEYPEKPSFSEYPDTFPREFELDYLPETRALIVDYCLPDKEVLPQAKRYKYASASYNRVQPVPIGQVQLNKLYDSVLYQVTLRTIYELFRWDTAQALLSIVFNGWVYSIDKATGERIKPCVLTVQAGKSGFLSMDLARVDPKECFKKLRGISASKLAAKSPVRPILQINREDKRFVNPRYVAGSIDNSTNLAAMDWEDFEQLIREVFESEFSGDGGEVKITRASRDHGVDAVAFDPDPIRGGKIVIQAKRYTNPVSVSAVRDLYGTILNEGANKGILVTTADYGPDAYEFAKGKPITLLNGSELLYLLQKHGHRARIDLAEARRLATGDGTTGSG